MNADRAWKWRADAYWELISRTSWKRWSLTGLCGAALFFLYLFGLTRTGLLGPDEPRYAAIGRWQRAVVNALSGLVLAFLAARLWVVGESNLATHEVTMTLHIPHGPFALGFALLCALAAIAAFVLAAAQLQRALGRAAA